MKKHFYDYLGIAGSGMCMIHCLAMPILFFIQNSLAKDVLKGLDLENVYLDYLFVLLCFAAVFSVTKHHNSWKISTSFWVFFVLFAISVLFEEDFEHLDFLGYGASIGLIITHIINIKYCKKCQIENSPLPS
jgi:uncharacterized membrane protein YoaK (UPF0700 family)